uniref:BPTI/Kunitz inhibitor domain-containing protein n=1 Tax=Lates calcarifer TaxID=8187 RepID=A0A4W6CYM7_LATCA
SITAIPIDRGTCHGVEKRFAYNPETRRCQMFHYSGCGGNRNNFPDRKKCFKKCSALLWIHLYLCSIFYL